MISYAELLISRFATRGILIDTNLLLLYAVGRYDLKILERERFDRLAAYSIEDFQLLTNLTSLFRRRVTTPYVLAEVSNWIGYLSRNQEIDCLRGFVESLDLFSELPVDSFALGRHQKFPYRGLTDMALASYANDFLVITDDARLVSHLHQMNREALNINHLRQELGLLS